MTIPTRGPEKRVYPVLRPTEPLTLREAEKVTLRVVSLDSWQAGFDRILKKIHRSARKFEAIEIDADIMAAVNETKAQKHGR